MLLSGLKQYWFLFATWVKTKTLANGDIWRGNLIWIQSWCKDLEIKGKWGWSGPAIVLSTCCFWLDCHLWLWTYSLSLAVYLLLTVHLTKDQNCLFSTFPALPLHRVVICHSYVFSCQGDGTDLRQCCTVLQTLPHTEKAFCSWRVTSS